MTLSVWVFTRCTQVGDEDHKKIRTPNKHEKNFYATNCTYLYKEESRYICAKSWPSFASEEAEVTSNIQVAGL